jgi:drug/metabolite transporter (DMT)-like permease
MSSVPVTAPRPFPVFAFICLLLGAMGIGFAGILMRWSDVNPIASAFWRMALAIPVLWIWALSLTRQDQQAGKRVSFSMVLLWAGINFSIDLALWHLGLHYTTVSNATLLSNFAPIFISLWMWIAHKQRFARIFLIGMAIALVGAVLLVSPQGSESQDDMALKMLGNAFGLASAIFYAAYQLGVKKARDDYSTVRLMAWITTVNAFVLLPFALMSPGNFWPVGPMSWLPLVGLALIAQIGGQTVIAYASAHLPASFSSVGLLFQPLTAAVAAWIIFNEALGPMQMVGGVLLLWGIYLSKRGS